MRKGFGEVSVDAHLGGCGLGDEAAHTVLWLEVLDDVNMWLLGLKRLQAFVAPLGGRLDLVARAGGVGDAEVGIGWVGKRVLHQVGGVPHLFAVAAVR